MKTYIQTNNTGTFYNINDYTAYVGFDALGYEIEKYVDANLVKDLDKELIFVGGIGSIRKRLKKLNITIP